MSEIGIDENTIQETTSTSTRTMEQLHPITSGTTTPSVHDVHECNWEGSIPIVLSLSATSIGSSMTPPSIHVMVARNTFLHIGLQYAIVHVLAQYAFIMNPKIVVGGGRSGANNTAATATTSTTIANGILQVSEEPDDETDDHTTRSSTAIHHQQENQPHQHQQQPNSSDNDDDDDDVSFPVCWFEDETTKAPLRWQYFVGVLYDMIHSTTTTTTTTTATTKNNLSSSSSLPNTATATMILPWRITVHFNHYPSAQYILPMEYPHDVVYTVQNIYKHTIKQSMTIIHGNSKFAMYNISKELHESLWNAICTNNYTVFRQVNFKLLYSHNDSNHANDKNSDDVVDGRDSNDYNNTNNPTTTPQQQIPIVAAIPIRVMSVQTTTTTTITSTTTSKITIPSSDNILPPKQPPPMIQKRVDYHTYHSLSLGQLLHDWLPDHFVIHNNRDDDDETTTSRKNDKSANNHPVIVVPNRNKVICWKINGIFEPSLQLSSSLSSLFSQSEQSESQRQHSQSATNNNNNVNKDNSIYNLWKYCHQPDYFLYIIVITK